MHFKITLVMAILLFVCIGITAACIRPIVDNRSKTAEAVSNGATALAGVCVGVIVCTAIHWVCQL